MSALKRTYTEWKISPEEARRLVASAKRQGLISVRPIRWPMVVTKEAERVTCGVPKVLPLP